MTRGLRMLGVLLLGIPLVALPQACQRGRTGAPGASAVVVVDASTASDETLQGLDVVSEVTSVTIASPPVVRFTVTTAGGVPIVGLVPFWEENDRFVRFTLSKLVPGQDGDPDSWVAYVREDGEPTYDTGSSLVDNRDGSYTFTFLTDVKNVTGVTYEPTLTHRVAGQVGQLSTVPLEEQNLWMDFVPTGSPVTHRRDIAVMERCNECHDNLVFHGRRFQVEYCVQCHNPDLAMGEGDFSFMIHRIHSAGTFAILDDGVDYSEVTYPQDAANCRKCHDEVDSATPQADHWMTLPNIAACDGCHNVFATNTHSGPALTDNTACTLCHGPGEAEEVLRHHTTPNTTRNNPELIAGQRRITYKLISAEVDGSNDVTIRFKILSNGTPLDLTDLPTDLVDPNTMRAHRYPAFLLAWAQPQDGISDPADYNNLGERSAQPLGLGLDDFSPIETGSPIGTLAFNPVNGIMKATITDAGSQFPVGATLRAVALEGYMQQDLDADGADDVSLHTPSVVAAVAGDRVRREVVDASSCSDCHEYFEGHGGNRVFTYGSDMVCTLCHVPNLSSSGRTIDPTDNDLAGELGADPLVFPEDAQNFKDLIHGIHASDFRTRDFEHVRGGRQGYYNWDEVTFPRGASTSKCMLCHKEGTYELPLEDGVLATTVRTTGVSDGLDADLNDVEAAFQSVPNTTDWVNTAMASSCFYCHTSTAAWAHMASNGALVSPPGVADGPQSNRTLLATAYESCAVCHGPGKISDVAVVHNR